MQYDGNSQFWTIGEPVNFDNSDRSPSSQNTFANIKFWDSNWAFDGALVQRKYIIEIPCGEGRSDFNLIKSSDTHPGLSIDKLYPNPTFDWIHLDLNNELQERVYIQIFSATGNLMETLINI